MTVRGDLDVERPYPDAYGVKPGHDVIWRRHDLPDFSLPSRPNPHDRALEPRDGRVALLLAMNRIGNRSAPEFIKIEPVVWR